VTSSITGKLVSKTIGGVTCGLGGSVNCTNKIIYNQAPLNATCTVRGSNGTPGTCDAVQNTVANRYKLDGLSCNTLPPCFFASGASSGYVLNGSISLTQPFALVAAAFTINSSSTETFLSVGNASIKFSTSSPGNILSSCDSSGGATAAPIYQNQTYAPSYVNDIVLTCIGGTGNVLQNTWADNSTNVSTGGSTSASGTPVVMATGGSPINFWAFGITTANFTASISDGTTGLWVPYAIHNSHCLSYGYTCLYSGIGDVATFKAAWGMRQYSGGVTQPVGQALFKACSADNTQCTDILSAPRNGMALNGTVGGSAEGNTNLSCWTTIASGTYVTATGVTVLTVNTPSNVPAGANPTGLASTNNFALSNLTGTGGFASLNGGWTVTAVTNTGGGDTATITFTAPTGLGTSTITGGFVSTCTIQVFYDISGANYCSGPCPLTQNTVANRAIWTYQCSLPGYVPSYYNNSCATFVAGNSESYSSPAATTIPTPFSIFWAGQRTGNTSAFNTVLGGTGSSTASTGFANSANNSYWQDGATLATGTANDNLFHSVLGESDGSNIHLYVDGLLSSTTATSSGGQIVAPFGLGNKLGNSFYCQCQFLEGGIANTDITSLAPALNQQAQALWRFP
jgi:hypothetical protein